MYHSTYLTNILNRMPDHEAFENWHKQLANYLTSNIAKFSKLKGKQCHIVYPISKPDINPVIESKYYYDPRLIGEVYNDIITNFNIVLTKQGDQTNAEYTEIINNCFERAVRVVRDLLFLGLLSSEENNWKYNTNIIEKSLLNNDSVFDYIIKQTTDKDEKNKIRDLDHFLKITILPQHITFVVLNSIFNQTSHNLWRNENTTLFHYSTNLLALQLFNRGMYYNYPDLLKYITVTKDTPVGEYDLMNVFIISLFRLWLTNTFDISEYIHNPNYLKMPNIYYHDNEGVSVIGNDNWVGHSITVKQLEEYCKVMYEEYHSLEFISAVSKTKNKTIN